MRRRSSRHGAELRAAVLCGLAIRSARAGLPLLAMCALPLANGSITLALLGARARPIPQWALDGFLRYSGNLRSWTPGCAGGPLLLLAAVAAWLILSIPTVAAAPVSRGTSFLWTHRHEWPGCRATRAFGARQIRRLSYLSFCGRRKVYFHGCSDFLWRGVRESPISADGVRPGWRQQIRQFAFTHALLPVDAPLRAGLESGGWQIVYQDKVAVLLAAPPE
ncbi:MAG: hypothetical protein IPP47_21485 [Bryobacterales bacterium]|nr:hypothetical protein [Bryobacterales bacterium]